MYIRVKQNLKVIDLQNSKNELIPRILSTNTNTDPLTGIVTKNFQIKFFCKIDKENYEATNCDSIEALMSSKPLDYYMEKADQSLSDSISSFPENRQERNENSVLANQAVADFSASARAEILTHLFDNTKKITTFAVKNKKRLRKKRKKVIVESSETDINQHLSDLQKEAQESILKNSKNFKKKYHSLLKQGIDPLFIFENSYGKNSSQFYKNGLVYPNNPLKLNSFHQDLEKTLSQIQNQIRRISSNQKKFRTRNKIQKTLKLGQIKSLSSDEIDRMQDTVYVILIAKNRSGLVLDIDSYSILKQDLLIQTAHNSTNYQISSVRKNITGVSKLVIGNNSTGQCDLSVYAKQIGQSDNLEYLAFKKLGNYSVASRSKTIVHDNVAGYSQELTPRLLTTGKNVIYRTMFNYKNIDFDNTKTTFCKTYSKYNSANPHCVLTSKIEDGFISVTASKVSPNVKSLRLCKYELISGARRHKKLTMSSTGRKNKSLQSVGFNNTLAFVDYDVFDNETYEYFLECIMDNGEKKIGSQNCIDKYMQRQNLINLSGMSYKRRGLDVELKFNMSRNENVILDFVRSAYRSVLSESSQNIQQLQSLSSFKLVFAIEKINKTTGDVTVIGQRQLGNDNISNVTINDKLINASHDICYKILPALKSTDEMVQNILNLLQSSNSLNNSTAAAAANISRGLYNAKQISYVVRQKYSSTSSLRRGLIESDNIVQQKITNDLFYDAYTGDIYYIDVPSLDDISENSLRISYNDCYTINESLKGEVDSGFSLKNSDELKRVFMSFSASNDAKIDFYAIFVKDGQQVYLDGAVNSRDSVETSTGMSSENIYNYLVEHLGNSGAVEYYAVPVTKTGNILGPRLIIKKVL